ncbi:MAG: hypothetical protein ABI604_13235 [Nitrospirota bacterium]
MEHALPTPTLGQFLRRHRPLGLYGYESSIFARCSPKEFEKPYHKGMQPALTLKMPPIPVEQIFAQFQEQVDKVSAFLPALDAGEGSDENCYRIFKGLLMETRDGFANAADAWKGNDYRRLAWATRSLVELKIWTKYVIASKENALALNREYDVDNGNMWALLKPALNTDAGQQLLLANLSDTAIRNDRQSSATPRFSWPHRRRGLHAHGKGREGSRTARRIQVRQFNLVKVRPRNRTFDSCRP